MYFYGSLYLLLGIDGKILGNNREMRPFLAVLPGPGCASHAEEYLFLSSGSESIAGMSLFVMGTASHVGKSVTVAAICRCLVRRGIAVAPFKSQNMSLNSFVTPEGGEIGMAQAMQAHAAKIPPHTDMNPVLLKPKGDCISQVVLNGRPYKDVPITDYYRETQYLLKRALESYGPSHLVIRAGCGGRGRRGGRAEPL